VPRQSGTRPPRRRSAAGLWGPPLAVMAAIFILSSLPRLPAPPGIFTDKHAHFVAYGVLSALVFRALAGGRRADFTLGRGLAAIAIATTYGVTDEWHQSFVPGRQAEWPTWRPTRSAPRLAAAALWAWSIIGRSRRRRSSRGLEVERRRHRPAAPLSIGRSVPSGDSMSYQNLLLTRDEAVAVVTVNRPTVLNALNAQTMDELRRAFLDLRHDAAVRAVVLTGAGEKAFVAGADIGELATLDATTAATWRGAGQHVFDLVEHLGKPSSPRSTGSRSAAAASWRWRARSGSRPTRRGSASPRSTSASSRLRRHAAAGARWSGRDRALDLMLTGDHVTARRGARDRAREPRRARAELLTRPASSPPPRRRRRPSPCATPSTP
jgi:hypothetical protein